MSFNATQALVRNGKAILQNACRCYLFTETPGLVLVGNKGSISLLTFSKWNIQKLIFTLTDPGNFLFSRIYFKLTTQCPRSITTYHNNQSSRIVCSVRKNSISGRQSVKLFSVYKQTGLCLVNCRYSSSGSNKFRRLTTFEYIQCCVRAMMRSFRFWNIVCRLGVPRSRVIKFRRSIKRYTYPWIKYSIPAAFIFGTGDMLAQYLVNVDMKNRNEKDIKEVTLKKFFREEWKKERTLMFMLLGLLLVGPMLSKWSVLLCRKLRYRNRITYIAKKISLDILLLSPIILLLMAIIYDQRHGTSIFRDCWKDTKTTFQNKYFPAIKEIMIMNILTRPLMAIIVCFLLPCSLRRWFKTLYEIWFAAYVSSTFFKHHLRELECKPPPPPASEQNKRCGVFRKYKE